jgi:hypothetical protein
MESSRITNETPIGQVLEVKKGLEKGLVDEGWLLKCCVPARHC